MRNRRLRTKVGSKNQQEVCDRERRKGGPVIAMSKIERQGSELEDSEKENIKSRVLDVRTEDGMFV